VLVSAVSAGFQPRAAPVNGAGASQNPPSGSGAISGVVLDAGSNQPLSGAEVTVSGSSRDGTGGRVTTDDAGRFVFTGLSARIPYAITAAKSGYRSGTFGAACAGPAGHRVVLQEGEWFRSASLRLSRSAAITGTVTDDRGEPVVAASVRAFGYANILGTERLAAGPASVTDDLGQFRIWGLPAGRFAVLATPRNLPILAAASSSGGASVGREVNAPVFFPAARLMADAGLIHVAPGEVRAGTHVRIAAVPAVRLEGTVVGPPEDVSGLVLRLVTNAKVTGHTTDVATAAVANDGSFSFAGIPSGDYTLWASRFAVEYVMDTLAVGDSVVSGPEFGGGLSGIGSIAGGGLGAGYRFRAGRGARNSWGRVDLRVDDRDIGDVLLRLTPSGRITGRIVWDPPGSGVTRPSPNLFRAEPADGDETLGIAIGQNRVGDLTQFTVPGLQQGRYVLRAGSTDGAQIKRIDWEGRDYTHRAFDVAADSIDNVVVTLTSQRARLMGRVRTAQGAVATDAAVIAFPSDLSAWTDHGFGPTRVMSQCVAADGAFEFDTLPAGSYHLIAVDSSLGTEWQVRGFLDVAAAAATPVTIEWGQSTIRDLVTRTVPWRRQ
jgi:hypothetical protein